MFAEQTRKLVAISELLDIIYVIYQNQGCMTHSEHLLAQAMSGPDYPNRNHLQRALEWSASRFNLKHCCLPSSLDISIELHSASLSGLETLLLSPKQLLGN